jgi:hypothetical protein
MQISAGKKASATDKAFINQKSITRIMHYSTYHTLPEKTIQPINQPTDPR